MSCYVKNIQTVVNVDKGQGDLRSVENCLKIHRRLKGYYVRNLTVTNTTLRGIEDVENNEST